MKYILKIAIILLFYTSSAQEKDYSELKYIYSDLVDVFKSEDDLRLKDFCYRLATDEITLEYMQKNSLCYRGIPCKMDEKGMNIKSLADEFYTNLLIVRKSLKHNGHLDSLTHINSTEYKWDVEIFVNEKIDGYDKIVNQNHYSISMKMYAEALTKADSASKSIEDLLLNGKKGDVIIVKGTEMPMLLKSGNKIIRYSIGEMVFINDKWNLFTKPNNDYSVNKE